MLKLLQGDKIWKQMEDVIIQEVWTISYFPDYINNMYSHVSLSFEQQNIIIITLCFHQNVFVGAMQFLGDRVDIWLLSEATFKLLAN